MEKGKQYTTRYNVQRSLPNECSMYQEYRKQLQSEMATSRLNYVLFLGSVREGRLGLRVAKFMQSYLEKSGHNVELFGKCFWIYLHIYISAMIV